MAACSSIQKPEVICDVYLSVLMLCAPSNRRRPFSYHTKMADFNYVRVLSVFSSVEKQLATQKSVLNMASSDSQIDKPQPSAELTDVNINTGAQNINTERSSLRSLDI